MSYYIVETVQQLDKLPPTQKCYIELITKSDSKHPSLTTPSIIYYNNFEKGFILVLNHSEGFSLPMLNVQAFLNKHEEVYLINKKKHSYYLDLPNSIDVAFTVLESTDTIKETNCTTPIHLDFRTKHYYLPNTECLIPISKHYERCECLFDMVKKYIGAESDLTWLNQYVEVYKWVEEQGLAIDEKLLDKYYELSWKDNSVKDNKIYTQYNLYNRTSRPTNAFNGLNFLALKKDKTRKAFKPANDFFADFDFDGYHVRLVARLLDITLPADQSIHTYLGKLYFKVDELTDEMYQESKKITFRQLYNGVEDDIKSIELFRAVDDFICSLWETHKSDGFIVLPNGRKFSQDDPSPQKLFNYYMQCLETVNNVKKLSKLKQYLKDKKSKVVLVVYDSILVDFSKEDGMDTFNQIKAILEEDNYLVKVKVGSNYSFED